MAIMQEIETKLQKGISVSTDEEVYSSNSRSYCATSGFRRARDEAEARAEEAEQRADEAEEARDEAEARAQETEQALEEEKKKELAKVPVK